MTKIKKEAKTSQKTEVVTAKKLDFASIVQLFMTAQPRLSAKKTSKLEEKRNDLTAQIDELNDFLEVENDEEILKEVANLQNELESLTIETEKTSSEKFGLSKKWRFFLYLYHNPKGLSLAKCLEYEQNLPEGVRQPKGSLLAQFFNDKNLSRPIFKVIGLVGSSGHLGFLQEFNKKLGSESLKAPHVMKIFGREGSRYTLKNEGKEIVKHFLMLQGFDADNFGESQE